MSEDFDENYDVASRLAQGRPAVDTVQRYVWACHQLGYQHQDLTLHPSQVRDGYGTEDGMDLGALQRGCVALEAAVHASQDALAVQDRQFTQLSAVWQGMGGGAAQDFLRRHGDASAAVAAAVRTAADALATLREDLWREVGTKADAVVAIEARAANTRADWLAAATTVTSGVGDRSAASELVDTAVKPFVDSSIRADWLAAMHATVTAVTAAYERALSEMAAERPPVFDVPGALGPTLTPPEPVCDDEPSAPPAAAASPAAAATAPSSWTGPAPVPAPAAMPPAEPVPAAAMPPVPPAVPPPVPPAGPLGSGIPGMGGSALPGIGQPFTDALSGLLGAGSSGLPEPSLPKPDLPDLPDLPEPDLPEPDDPDEEEALDDPEGEAAEAAEEEAGEEPEEAVVIGDAEAAPDPCEPAATPPPPPPPPAEPLPTPAEPVTAEQTPCEIAADEVPQVGEPAE